MDIRKVFKKCHAGDLEALKAFQQQYPDGTLTQLQYDASGDTILHHAAQLGHLEMVIYLLDYFMVDCRNKDNKTPLHLACQFAQVEVASELLNRGADVNALKKADWTPLMLACTKLEPRSLQLIGLLIDHKAVLNFQNKDGWSVLHLICRVGNASILKYLLSKFLSLTTRTNNGNTGLHIAALHAHPECWRVLIEHGLDTIHVCNAVGNLPLHEAVLSKNLNMVKECVTMYTAEELNQANSSGCTVIHLAVFIGSLDIVKFLITLDYVDIHQVTQRERQNCLHLAARNSFWNVYTFCQSLGMKETEDKYGRKPSDYNKMPVQTNHD